MFASKQVVVLFALFGLTSVVLSEIVKSENNPASRPGHKLRGDLVNLVKNFGSGAAKMYEDVKPHMEVVQHDLMESLENLKNNPRVVAANNFAKPRIEAAKSRVAPIYEQGRDKIQGLIQKHANGASRMPFINRAVRPVAPEQDSPVAPMAAEVVPIAESAPAVVEPVEMAPVEAVSHAE